MQGPIDNHGSTKMSRSARINIGLVILIALAAFFLMRVHTAGGAKLGNASEGHRLAEAWCKPCHAIEPHMAGLLDQSAKLRSDRQSAWHNCAFVKGVFEDQPCEHAESCHRA
jgi:hypothetical protein